MKGLALTQTVPLAQEVDGTIRVGGSRVTLDTLVGAFQKGATAEQIQDSFPSVSLQQVYATIAYYLEHQADVEEYLKMRREEAASIRAEIEGQQDTAGFRDRVVARRRQLIRT
jgi:uncharacterized protein (DUF433 family)